MTAQDFTTEFTVDNTPEEVFAAINNVRGWWSGEIVGETTKLGDTFKFEVPAVHRTTQTLTEVIPRKRVVWHVTDSWIGFVDDKSEWDDSDIVFDITAEDGKTAVRLTHVGLTPNVECFDTCSNAWSAYMLKSLRELITTGKGDLPRQRRLQQ
ncbi:MAG TPA: SRPBCC domain-containing protein [Propionibacteriaceae bacterium]|jgi:hypothetical protein|nr:SRPBCC domain-containing protein [Propionibacteriaceae bacterium]